MKKTIVFIITLFLTTMGFAQTQQGYVKTKGRMVNGKLVPGQGIKGATVTVQGRNAVLVNADDGAFSFPVPTKTFQVQDVKKSGYQLVDADIIRRSFTYSATPIYIVMETPDQQLNDQLAAERKIRRTMQRELEERENEIDALKTQQKITEDEYRAALQKLYAEQEGNEKLIADMAKQYAQIDYDQMDELNQRISDAILNGRLTEADSLLQSKGSMDDRIADVRRELQEEAQREKEIAQQQTELSISKEGTRKKMQDISEDCNRFFDLYKLNHDYDSAAYFIQLRADLDTTNGDWQYDVAKYFHMLKQSEIAELYYIKALAVFRHQAQVDYASYAYDIARTMNSLGLLYKETKRYSESEKAYEEAMSIVQQQIQDNPKIFKPFLAQLLNNQAALYLETQHLEESETALNQALALHQILSEEDPLTYKIELAATLNNIGFIYKTTHRYTESERAFNDAIDICQSQFDHNPEATRPIIAQALINLSLLYDETQRLSESKSAYLEALEIRRAMAQDDPLAYNYDLAKAVVYIGMQLLNQAEEKEDEQAYMDAISYIEEALDLYRNINRVNPTEETQRMHEMCLFILSNHYYTFAEFEKCYLTNEEFLPILKKYFLNDPENERDNYVSIMSNQALVCLLINEPAKAEHYAREILSIHPSDHSNIPELATALLLQGKYTEAEDMYLQHKDELAESFMDYLTAVEELGVIPSERMGDVKRIRQLLAK